MQFRNPFYLSKKTRLMCVLLCLNFPTIGWCEDIKSPTDSITNLTASDSTIAPVKDSTTLVIPNKQKSNQIDAQIDYSAKDSIVFMGNGTAYLHGETDITYKTINLKSDFVKIRMDSSTIYARGTQDSTGVLKGRPVFKENEAEYESKELTYNLQTKKGYIRQAVTQQGEGYIISDKTKKTSDDLLCIAGGKYTTCDNHDHPDFYLSLSKAKVKPGAYIVTGPAHLVIQDVPLPIAIPFGFFPFTDKYSSGIIMPSIQDELTRGFGLTGGGYYFAVNDYMDLELIGDIYTKGTWALAATSNYVKKYKYRGSFSVSYREDVTGEKGFADYSKAKNLNIRWSHAQDQKANPFSTFSSSVNFSTSGYNRSNINSYSRPDLNSENTKSSSVSFTQRFPESPFSISGSMLINQRTKDSTISLTLPNISITMGRIYPLKRKNAVGKERWYEKISMSYSGTISNSINTKENLLLTSSFSNDWKNGIKHSIPVGATFNIFKYINISPSANYTERWYLNSTEQTWDNTNKKVIRNTVNGYNRVFDYNVGVSASTKLYGFYMPIRAIFGDKIDRIRHVMTPTIGYSYRPDFGEARWGYYSSYSRQLEEVGNPGVMYNETVEYSRFDQNLYGGPGKGKSGMINFGLGNNLEMKVRNDKDTTGTVPFKIISLINNLAVNGGYNIAVDSMQWSNFSTNLQIKLGKGYTLSLSGAFDPYMWGLNKAGNPVRINKLRWDNGGFPRFLGTSTSYSYTLNNDTFKKIFNKDSKSDNKEKNDTEKTDLEKTALEDTESLATETHLRKNEDGYAALELPWSISVNYSVSYANTSEFDKTIMEYNMDFIHNLSFSGNLSLTKNWRFTSSTTYDFTSKTFTYTNLNITRSLHCWSMTASVVPFGVYKSYNVRIGVNSSMLQDLKYDKQSEYGTNIINWY